MHGLDLLRMMLALAVVMYHYLYLGPATGEIQAAPGWGGLIWLSFGVSIFFVISGYVIFISIGNRTALAFARARFMRLWPALMVCSSLTLLVAVVFEELAPDDALAWLHAATLVPLAGRVTHLDASYWSLTYELRFYLLVAVLIGLGKRRSVPFVITALGVAESSLYWLEMAEPVLFPYVGLFGLGTALALARQERGPRIAALLAVNFAVASSGLALQFAGHAMTPDGSVSVAEWILVGTTVAAAAILLVAGAARLRVPARFAGISSLLGAASYPLYLLHQRVGYIGIESLMSHGISHKTAVLVISATVICASIAIALWFEPVLRRLVAAPGRERREAIVRETA